MAAAVGYRERIRDYFLARPGQWVSGYNLMRVGGMCAWRTRVSEVRRWDGLRIENRVRRYQDDGETILVSEYRYVPAESAPDVAECFPVSEGKGLTTPCD